MDEKNASRTRVLGLTLEQYAGIQTALLQGFPLEQVLKNERLSPARWGRARAAWGNKLAGDGHAGPLAAAFRHKSAEAASWLGRRITPLEDDLQAWCAFLGAYASEEAPANLLRRLGMRDTDVQRLVFTWKMKTDRDPDLAKKAAELTASKPVGIPSVRVTEGKLRPFPWSPGPEPERSATTALPAPETASPSAAGDGATGPRVLEVPSFLKVPPVLSPSAPTGPAAEPHKPAPAAPPKAGIGETMAVLSLPLPASAALPFSPGAPGAPAAPAAASSKTGAPSTPAAAPASDTGAAPPPGGGLSTGTAIAFELPRGPAVPFRPTADSAPAAEAKAASPQEASPGPASLQEASPGPASSQEASPKDGEAPPSAGNPGLTGTVLAFDLPRGPELPFPSAASAKLADPSRGVELAALARSIAARAAKPPPASPATPPAPPAPPPAAPPLTLEQHASLCAELAFHPDERAGILARYRVTEETMQALTRQYQDRPDRKAAWETAYRTYFEWLASRPRGRPST